MHFRQRRFFGSDSANISFQCFGTAGDADAGDQQSEAQGDVLHGRNGNQARLIRMAVNCSEEEAIGAQGIFIPLGLRGFCRYLPLDGAKLGSRRAVSYEMVNTKAAIDGLPECRLAVRLARNAWLVSRSTGSGGGLNEDRVRTVDSVKDRIGGS
jgi:hypothetical protein